MKNSIVVKNAFCIPAYILKIVTNVQSEGTCLTFQNYLATSCRGMLYIEMTDLSVALTGHYFKSDNLEMNYKLRFLLFGYLLVCSHT